MKLRKREHAALWIVGILASWTTFLVNTIGWELLYFLHNKLHLPVDLINYELSLWPVLIDIVILMSTVIWTKQQMRMSENQSETTETILQLGKNQTDMMRLLLALAEHMESEIGDIADDIDHIVKSDLEDGDAN